MFTLCVWFGNQQTPWAFIYTDLNKAAEQLLRWAENADPFLEFSDDFGQRMFVKRSNIQAVMLDDMKKSAEAKILVGLHGQRTQATYQTRVQADPALRFNGGGVPSFDPVRAFGNRN